MRVLAELVGGLALAGLVALGFRAAWQRFRRGSADGNTVEGEGNGER